VTPLKHPLHVLYAFAAAALYAIAAPLSKMLLHELSPAMLAGLLYLGAGVGMSVVGLFRRNRSNIARFAISDRVYVVLMVALDVAAPILLLVGLKTTAAANASLLNNFEIVATSLFAFFSFGEKISRRVGIGILLVTAASALLAFDEGGALAFSPGSLFIVAAATCWGLENNCTRMLSTKDPLRVVVVKGYGAGTVALAIAFVTGGFAFDGVSIIASLLLGFVAYGLSIFLYVTSQAHLGAARTASYYAIAPFIGAGLSIVLFRELPGWIFGIALALLLLGAWFVSFEPMRATHTPES